MNRIYRYRRIILSWTIPLLLVLFIDIPSFAQSKSGELKATNLKWTIKSDVIVINYDLMGSLREKYEIKVTVKNENDSLFSLIPTSLEGDAGIGYFGGPDREIQWYFKKDLPGGLSGEGYYFEISVKTVTWWKNWYYYVLGGTALTVGTILLLTGKSTTTTVSELPLPPARP